MSVECQRHPEPHALNRSISLLAFIPSPDKIAVRKIHLAEYDTNAESKIQRTSG
jgi:hypothetical protein